ncbi:MAG TPA: di-heme oxidoredictase family protein [Candidatus Angelobacter sp.]|nr:di-heme oxidoredictase family protein [Candidatus Angelobacter sp.]
MKGKLVSVAALVFAVALFTNMASAQSDPGVRSTTGINAGQALASVTADANLSTFFTNGLAQFAEHQVVTGGDNNGLGPRFNLDGCGGCHSQPNIGGSSPSSNIFPKVGPNPQSQAITTGLVSGSTNTMPSFVTANGPVREARFPFFFNANGTPNTAAPNGGVETLFTVSGRADAGSCNISQPAFATALANNNIIFRIPTPVFGAGLIENIDDSTLLANQGAQANNGFGIGGTFNHNGNDGTIARFGWKAQNKSLLLFAGEAYNVEMGVTNELFQQERPLPGEDTTTGLPSNCQLNPTPEDVTHANGTDASSVSSDIELFTIFMRSLAPPTPSTTSPGGASSIANGRSLFNAIGCATCHTPSLKTGPSNFTSGLSNATANLFSDLEIHHMGTVLADNVSQGGAGGDQFRTAPLWGLGQRIFFLHDGRCSDLLCAIEAHESNGGEATTAEGNFDGNLSASQQQDVLNFLRSL